MTQRQLCGDATGRNNIPALADARLSPRSNASSAGHSLSSGTRVAVLVVLLVLVTILPIGACVILALAAASVLHRPTKSGDPRRAIPPPEELVLMQPGAATLNQEAP